MRRLVKDILIVAAVAALTFIFCSRANHYVVFSGYAQGGTYAVKANIARVRASQQDISSAIDSILTLVDTTLSGYNKSSILSRRNAGDPVAPNALYSDILEYCTGIFEETGGCVNVAAAPLFDIWGFGFSTDSLPSPELVARTLEKCDIASPTKLNFNAVAQGYTCDMVAAYLHSIGVKDMLVDIGEIYCEGLNPSRKPWSIGVDRPVDGNETPGADLDGVWSSEGRSCGIVTSGNYRKFYVRDGHKYAHTIDPRTGYPVSHNLLSATIVAPTAAAADAYATYCMVTGLEEARDFILGRDDLEGYLIYDDGGEMKEWRSEGFTLRRD